MPVQKAALKTTEMVDPPVTSIFTPDTEFGSRLLIEVVRGCANLCRFCWAGYNYLPVRPFPPSRTAAGSTPGGSPPGSGGTSLTSWATTCSTSRGWGASGRPAWPTEIRGP